MPVSRTLSAGERMEQKQGSGWKWIAGGLALIVTYQLGYESGSKGTLAAQPSFANSSYATPLPDVTAVDALTPTSSPTMAEALSNLTSDPSEETTTNTTEVGETPAPSGEPWKGYRSDPIVIAANDDEASDDGEDVDELADSLALAPTPAPTATAAPAAPSTPLSTYVPPKPVSYGCAENGSCYGDISATTGRPKTVAVRGYYRKDGTYVRGHYRSRSRY